MRSSLLNCSLVGCGQIALLGENQLFPTDPMARDITRALYEDLRDLPIVSPHGHTDPQWFAKNEPFRNTAELFATPDHYMFRTLHSQGIPFETRGVPITDDGETKQDPRKICKRDDSDNKAGKMD